MKNQIQLRDYQKLIVEKGCEVLAKYKIVYLAMEVWTGKTLTSFAIAQCHGAKKVLFVTKKKAIPDILQQHKEFNTSFDIHVTNYEQLTKVKDIYDLVIIDEAHSLGAIPTPSLRAKELKRICVGLPIIYLSGTPTPESYSQIYHQLYVSSFSPFKEYKNFYQWAKDYVILQKKYVFNRAINDYSNAIKDKVMDEVKKVMISLTQEDAGFEQLVKEHIIYVEMEASTYKVADRLRIDKIVKNKDGDIVLGDTAVKLMSKLHQIYSGSVIVDEPKREARAFDYKKAEFIKDKFKGQKIAIFYKFTAELYIIKWIFGEVFVDPMEFNAHEGSCVFASQIQSGREGINLSSADALVFMNIDFSAVSYWQSRARIQTKDRTKDAHIYWIFAKGGIEEKIYKAVMNKKDYTLEHFKKDYL
jgi:SNF2 family DNA or RNA helicase